MQEFDSHLLKVEVHVRGMLHDLVKDPQVLNDKRLNLKDTPRRVTRMYHELLSGYDEEPKELLEIVCETATDSMVIVKDIEFTSLCAHHLAVFRGSAHVGYIPCNGRIVGLSKIARVVDAYAKRLQLQELLTEQIASCIDEKIDPQGVMVVLEATHDCMCLRGVKKKGVTVTSAVRGLFLEDQSVKEEFLSLIRL